MGNPSLNLAKGQGVITSYFKSENLITSMGPIVGKVLNTNDNSYHSSVNDYPISNIFSITEEENIDKTIPCEESESDISRKL